MYKEKNKEFSNELQERLFKFAVNVILACRGLPQMNVYKIITYQLIKSATSSGTNYEEAQCAVSRAGSSNKVGIALKEIRDSSYWIKIIIAITLKNGNWVIIKDECFELMNILGSVYSKTSAKR